MDRRSFLLRSAAVGAAAALPRFALAADGTLYMYSSSDSNIVDFWTNVIVPRFNATNPGVALRVVDAGDNAGLRAIGERALAALPTGADPQAEMFESFRPEELTGTVEAGLWVDLSQAGLSNWSRVNPAALESNYSMPYRGSQVLLAYDATRLNPADAPKSWDELTAWIKANPGQFIYNRPDKGGSGGNFVRRAIHEANGRDPGAFTVENYSDAFAAEALGKAWDILNDIAPALYERGSYSAGNTQSIQLLAQGVVTMTPVWSDQVLSAIGQGVLPETTGLVQLQDLALCGGFSRAVVLANGVQKEAALKLADFLLTEDIQSAVLTELGGFPGVSWDYVDPALREQFKDVIPTSIPTFPGGAWESAINDGWYRAVAPNVARD
ncbi:ABC transporter substrate binding protein [Ketogulonicigenium robustum]|uniref:ABC transporter substrate binding protein n=1 Tax=Ketogulonicigenium robustum TaxID=92947 RepID=A0A1W6P174_9RHOB|nr:extracellular solute-binding protein [Ketogulonicigenium robustum]ARO15268.1 ABC transporter substrate binding protein [Ketogulonicigenium robustum]